jgi:hypothetical protein
MDEPHEWPLHERLAGIAGRAAALSVGLLPAWLAVLNELRWRASALDDFLTAVVVMMVFFTGLLATERRDGHATVRLAVGAALGTVLAPVALASLQNIGDLEGAMGALDDRFVQKIPSILGMALFATVVVPLLVPLFAVRARTTAPGPQVAACALTVITLGTMGVDEVNREREMIGLLLVLACGVTAPLALWYGERRFVARWDPAAPKPVERDPRQVLAVYALLALPLASVPRLSVTMRYHQDPWDPIHDELVRVWEEMDRPPRERPRNLAELSTPSLAAGELRGHVLRLVVSADGTRWAFAADAISPVVEPGFPHRVLDDEGAVWSYPTPVAIDPRTCEPPPGGEHISRVE